MNLLVGTSFKSLIQGPLELSTSTPLHKMILDVEHLSVVDRMNNPIGYGVLDLMFDNPRFKLEAYASSAVTNWLLLNFAKSIKEINDFTQFNGVHLTGLLNKVVEYIQFSPTDIGLNLTECIQNFAYDNEFNIKTKYRSVRNDEDMNIDSWVDFIFNTLNEKMPLLLVGQSTAYLVIGIEKVDELSGYVLHILNNGKREMIDLIEWKKSTYNACLMKIELE